MKYILTLIIALIMLSCSDDATTQNESPCGKMPELLGGKYLDKLRIIAIMPNPAGNDDNAEYFVVKNFENKSFNLSEYSLMDSDSIIWNFPNITLNQCDTFKLVSDKSAQLLNSGDEIWLFRSKENQKITSSSILHFVNYTDAKDGVEIRFDK